MIKAYFFDWMETLGDINDTDPIKNFLTQDQHYSLFTKKFGEADIPKKYKDLIYSKLMNVKLTIYPDSEEIISNLKKDYKLAIISNMYSITVEKIRKLFPDFLSKFDTLTFSSEVGLRKPNSEIFVYTLDELNKICRSNIFPREVMMIGDKQDKDIGPALALGMQAKLIDRNKGQTLVDLI